MKKNNASILCTAVVDAAWIATAAEKNIQLAIIPFIITETIDSIDVQQEIEQAAIRVVTVVFTSSMAVESVITFLDGEIPEWKIYCIGTRTKQKAEQYFGAGMIAGSAANATALATLIIEDAGTDEVVFFCGNLRRDELPMLLEEESIQVTEVEVYTTKMVSKKIDGVYDAVIFFSPSAVESFFQSNHLNASVKIFAIGATTKSAVNDHCDNTVYMSSQPDKTELIEKAIAYFS